jgi:antitoxin component of RelBE/YafQ-DinJ toxin-antitoxin module
MKTTVTLEVDADALESAQAYADAHDLSLSDLVDAYLRALSHTADVPGDDTASPKSGAAPASSDEPLSEEEIQERLNEDWIDDLPPITKRLVGCIAGEMTEKYSGEPDESGRVDADVREDYYNYLREKHS